MPSYSDKFAAERYWRTVKGLEQVPESSGPRSLSRAMMMQLAPASFFRFHDDFVKLDTGIWTTNAGTGATAFAATADAQSGIIAAASGTNGTEANRMVNLYTVGRKWSGDLYAGMEVLLKVSAITDIQFVVGFIDTHDTLTTPVAVVPDIDTPTFASGLGDAAVVAMDTGETLKTMALCTIGSGGLAGATAAKVDLGTFAPTADTYFRIRIQLIQNRVEAKVWTEPYGAPVFEADAVGIEGGTAVRPIIQIAGLSQTSRTWTIDEIELWQDRRTF